jgi:hypothetical protein
MIDSMVRPAGFEPAASCFVARPIRVPPSLRSDSQHASRTLAFYNLGHLRRLRLVFEQDFVIWGLEDPVLEFSN